VRELVRQYYFVLRSVLRTKSHLRRCLVRCKHCKIFFLTHPRNHGRTNLRCPFGCRETHSNIESARRSADYYRTKKGKDKKEALNAKRFRQEPEREVPSEGTEESPAAKPRAPDLDRGLIEDLEGKRAKQESSPASPDAEREEETTETDEREFNREIVKHVQLVTGLLEGRKVSRAETLEMLKRVVRQRSIRMERRIDYIIRFLKEKNPP
jgi:hypothetical protein